MTAARRMGAALEDEEAIRQLAGLGAVFNYQGRHGAVIFAQSAVLAICSASIARARCNDRRN
jgi:hypothetical protein